MLAVMKPEIIVIRMALALGFREKDWMKKQFFFHLMYNKTIIRFGFCDIQNNQGLGKVISRSRLTLP